MRKLFSELLYKNMSSNSEIYLLTGDLGFGLFDNIKSNYDQNFYNMGSSEQLMIGAAIGLSLNNKIPVCYSITPFLLYRPFEFIRNYIEHEHIPVKLVGSGRDRDYSHDGFTHWAEDDSKIISNAFPSIRIYKPQSKQELIDIFDEFINDKEPSYLNLSRNI